MGVLSNFESQYRYVHFVIGIAKGVGYSILGLTISKVVAPSDLHLLLAFISVVAGTIVLQFWWLYQPEMAQHEELKSRLGGKYREMLQNELEESGMWRLYTKSWIAEKFDEMKAS